ncbi:MAG: NADH-quinone oxidoreductase subunit L [Acidimicrobiales bacterium]
MSLFAAAAAETFQPESVWFGRVWIVPALPALSFLLILLFGKRFKTQVHWVGLATVGLGLVISSVTAFTWITQYEDEQSHHGSEEGFVGDGIVTTTDEAEESDAAKGSGQGCLNDANTREPEDLYAVGTEYAAGSAITQELAVDAGDEGGKGEHIKAEAVVRCLDWFSVGAFDGDTASGSDTLNFSIGTIADGQSIMMLFVVTFISFLVHLFSVEYVKGDRRYVHYYAFLSLFTAAMLFMVLSSSTLQLIVGWELVGVCSFALIGHWWEDKPNSDAALKAFLTNRVGDIGLLVGMIVLFFGAGQTFDIMTINYEAVHGGLSQTTMTVASLCLLTAVMSKSGQFILHTWLPDAMAGPTPVSALIHAATMVVAGIYMVGRLYPVFWEGMYIEGSPVNPLAFVGALTVVGGGALAFVQNDVKKVLAYSTVSQLGYMVLALGVGAWTAGMFHLFTHAFFKACLFLGAGALSHACHHSFDMKAEMGGLRKKMPVTFVTFMIGTLALVGVFPFAGFWSKDEILVGTGGFPSTNANGNYTLLLIMGLIGAAMTAGYMTRAIWLIFFGEYRGHVEPHDPPMVMKLPLIILATFAVFAGFLNFPADWFGGLGERYGLKFEQWFEPGGGTVFPVIGHGDSNLALAVIASLIGIGTAALVWIYYQKLYATDPAATEVTDGLRSRNKLAAAGYNLLENKYYLDHLYTGAIVGATIGPIAKAAYWVNQNIIDEVINIVGRTNTALGRAVYRFIDQGVIDGTVNLSGEGASESGGLLRKIQTGRIRQYASLMFGAATVLAAIFIVAI